ncbi:RimJ/RimL family protein N-acetyltransferase [Mucilaginibacter sp. SG538B]|uniref:GNAT family N-acetyltransferase n=1 Tax=Mucilaginibacter sp. SG538B TaxID=2587021 RepID=UPI00159D6473|nr:GNAT family N-acetyltransferase [Mucilaginibacter sp. SG538B]NVM62374.1 RimJ/RimL family protein N-acetyltransferase [Mucilaginibacter sp. SG538B]
MKFDVVKVQEIDIESHRRLFLAEAKFQFVYNKCHGAGWVDTYLFKDNDIPIGYGSVWGKDKREERDTICEFFLDKPFRKHARQIFELFIKASGAGFVECQTNDILLAGMAFELTKNINAEAILFETAFETAFAIDDAQFVKSKNADEWNAYSIQKDGEVIATGGFILNYNFPYIDIYYEVKEDLRRQGYGVFLMQELKKEAYRLNRVPAARCNVNNHASKALLLKAGMRVCGYIIMGEIINELFISPVTF